MQSVTYQQNITEVLAEVANAVVGHLEIKTLLDQIINTTMRALDAEVCSIFLEDKEKEPEKLKCVAGSGFAEKIVGIAEYKITEEYGEGFTGTVAKLGKSFSIRNLEELQQETKKHGRWEGKYDKKQWPSGNNEFRNLLAAPLKIKDQTLGVIKVENKKWGDSFTNENLVVLEIIGNVVALTIENARLHQKAEEQSKSISNILADVVSEFVGQFNMDNLLNKIIETAMNTLHAEVCSIFLEDKEKKPGFIKCVAGSGFARKLVGVAEYKIGEGFTGTVAELGKEYNIRNREELEKGVWKGKFDNNQWEKGKNEFRNLLALPLKIKNQILGVIKVENKIENYGSFFSDEDLATFKTIANVIALTIENARLHHRAEEQLTAEKERDAWKEISFRAAHKMGNALFGLRGDVNWIQIVSNEKPLDENKIKSAILETTESLNAANTIIREFKGFILPDKLDLKFSDVNQILELTLSESEKSVDNKEVQFIREFSESIPMVKLDAAKIKLCIRELIENACYFLKNKKGQITIYSRISSLEDHQKMGIVPEEEWISIVVKDNGQGVLKDNKTKIFMPFFSTNAQGSGLGLAILQQYIEQHGGKIVEMGEYGQGAEFLIMLPVHSFNENVKPVYSN